MTSCIPSNTRDNMAVRAVALNLQLASSLHLPYVVLPGDIASELFQEWLNDPLPPQEAEACTRDHKDLMAGCDST